MNSKLKASLLLLFFLGPILSHSQIYDFDSLVNHDTKFRAIANNISDTLDLFNGESVLNIKFESDFKQLVKNKYKDEYQDATFRIMLNDTVQVSMDIKIKPRGNMRKGSCFMPPLKLNFPKKEAFIKQLEHFDKLKMVLDCKRSDLYEQYLISEYYAYKMNNIITEYSLRVRLLKVSYIDLGGRFKDITRYAFIIESIDQLNARLNTIRIEKKGIRDILTNHKILADSYLFQYLIGNTDWSIPNLHNIYMVKSMNPNIHTPYVIPYDFDYAGIVNTNYAIPDEQLGIDNVRDRLYRGVCQTSNQVINSKNLILEKKAQFYMLFEQDTYMSKYNKQSTIKYIDDFFQIIENENTFKRHILDECR